MSNPATEIKIWIEATDDEGVSRRLCVKDWSLITGKSERRIREDYHKKKSGAFISTRQVVGLDEIDHKAMRKERDDERARIESERNTMVNSFLRRRLV